MPLVAQTLPAHEIESLLDSADSKADHLKLAGHYAAEAEQLRQGMARHERMAARYKRFPPKASPQRLAKHCADLAASLRNAAKAAEELAAAHREMAEESQ
jgi:hypothetical protein